MVVKDKTKTNPGMHKQFRLEGFSDEEKSILRKLSGEWYLTNSGRELKLATSKYNFFLMKPTQIFEEMFNINREVLCVFSNYERFEPRTLDAFDAAQQFLSEYRIESICKVLISKDESTEGHIESFLKLDPEQPIVVPFTYRELLSPYNNFFIRNRFQKHLYTRDLFSFLSPLKKDLYFFGRNELVQEITNRHRAGEHTGLFGLRKCGKTSIIYAIERMLASNSEDFISIDCESPSIHLLRWNELLFRVASMYQEKRYPKKKQPEEEQFIPKYAADSFGRYITETYKAKRKKPTLIIFDEIERIAPGTASSEHWRDGDDFVYFWQSMRAFYQRNPEIFSYMIVGTNPSCVEAPVFNRNDNPLFGSIPHQYVPAFSVEQVREMVRKLGRYMGLKFEEVIYSKLKEDFGGHPFLIRQMCSQISSLCSGDRPFLINKALYEEAKKDFSLNSADYLDMIIQVLKDWYPEEYDMLVFLAQGDFDIFNQFAKENPDYVRHLIGYGLIEKGKTRFDFNIESIKSFLKEKHKYERVNLTQEEKASELSERRNALEKSLRELIKRVLQLSYGKREAYNRLCNSFTEERKKKLNGVPLDDLLSSSKSPLYFNELTNVIEKEWAVFEKVFEMEKPRLSLMLNDINKYGRNDAHAKDIDDDIFIQLRLHYKQLERIINDF